VTKKPKVITPRKTDLQLQLKQYHKKLERLYSEVASLDREVDRVCHMISIIEASLEGNEE
jgi:hypothetical protein